MVVSLLIALVLWKRVGRFREDGTKRLAETGIRGAMKVPHCPPRSRAALTGLVVLLFAVQGVGRAAPAAAGDLDALVSVEWLNEHLADPGLVVLDCSVELEPREGGGLRPVSGRAAYEAGHVPGAGFADLKGRLCDADSPLDFALLPPDEFCAAMGALGVGDETRVVLYDRSGSVWAARVWWMLRSVGFDRAALLDGGWKRWTRKELPQESGPVARDAAVLSPRPRPRTVADRDEVLAAIGQDAIALVDGLPAPHYRGEVDLYGRSGHVPGAINVPALSLLDASGRYRPIERLRAMIEIDPARRVIVYCGGGASASSVAFTLVRLGYADVAVYLNSLQEWAGDDACPLVIGEGE